MHCSAVAAQVRASRIGRKPARQQTEHSFRTHNSLQRRTCITTEHALWSTQVLCCLQQKKTHTTHAHRSHTTAQRQLLSGSSFHTTIFAPSQKNASADMPIIVFVGPNSHSPEHRPTRHDPKHRFNGKQQRLQHKDGSNIGTVARAGDRARTYQMETDATIVAKPTA